MVPGLFLLIIGAEMCPWLTGSLEMHPWLSSPTMALSCGTDASLLPSMKRPGVSMMERFERLGFCDGAVLQSPMERPGISVMERFGGVGFCDGPACKRAHRRDAGEVVLE